MSVVKVKFDGSKDEELSLDGHEEDDARDEESQVLASMFEDEVLP